MYSQILMNMIHNSLVLRDGEERQEHSGGIGDREGKREWSNFSSIGTLSLSKTPKL